MIGEDQEPPSWVGWKIENALRKKKQQTLTVCRSFIEDEDHVCDGCPPSNKLKLKIGHFSFSHEEHRLMHDESQLPVMLKGLLFDDAKSRYRREENSIDVSDIVDAQRAEYYIFPDTQRQLNKIVRKAIDKARLEMTIDTLRDVCLNFAHRLIDLEGTESSFKTRLDDLEAKVEQIVKKQEEQDEKISELFQLVGGQQS